MKIFLSYASEDRPVAAKIHLALLGSDYQVFFDKANLPVGRDFHARIRSAVNESDVFIFLISPRSVVSGAYTLTELRYARNKWPHPKEHVLPVLIEPVSWELIDEYLKAVTILEPDGNIAAEVTAEISKLGESMISIDGSWQDPNSPGNGSHITQDRNTFRFNGWGVLPDGTRFESSGSGTVTGRNITSTYQARYQNGWVSHGECKGTVNPDGSQMSLTCNDSILGTFVSSGVRG